MRTKSLCLALLIGLTSMTATAYVVTSVQDTVTGGTLREAILAANAGGVPATIGFDITGGCSPNCQIALASPLPIITVPLTIDGYTQPGSSPNTAALGNDDAVRKIVLNVNYQPGGFFQFGPAATNSVVRGFYVVNYDTRGIDIQASGVAVEGNRFGLDGQSSYGPAIVIEGAADLVRVGGTTPAQRNLLGQDLAVQTTGNGTLMQGNDLRGLVSIGSSGASVGSVSIGGIAPGAGNLVASGITVNASNGFSIGSIYIQGNTIGTDPTGSSVNFGGSSGISLFASGGGAIARSLIGGNASGGGNLIATGPQGANAIFAHGVSDLTITGNSIGCNKAVTGTLGSGAWAIDVEGGDTFGNSVRIGGPVAGEGNVIAGGVQGGIRIALTTATIESNFIGIAPDLKTALSNIVGILVDSADASIGGLTAAQRNVIAYNYEDGVRVDISMPAIRNAAKATVNGNAIYNNGRMGIYFFGTGQVPLPNDPGDGDTGPNGFQNYPILSSAAISGGQVSVSGDLDSMPNTLYRIEWFANTVCDPSGYGEGRLPLGGGNYMTDGSGHVSFSGVMLTIPPGYTILTATATDPAGNTSEFSPCFTTTGPSASFYTLPPCRLSDTRNANGPYGGPSFLPGQQRSYVVAGRCGVPSNAVSVALNVAVTAPSGAGNLVLFAGEAARPATSTINYGIGRTKSDDAIVPLGPSGELSVFANQAVGRVDVIIDVTGYFQ
jgi:hypothetical protein